VGKHDSSLMTHTGGGLRGPAQSHLPGGRPDGVFLGVIVLFAHFFCGKKK
jgi:hypothetical protein